MLDEGPMSLMPTKTFHICTDHILVDNCVQILYRFL